MKSIQRELGWQLTEHKLIELARSIDYTNTGRINYLEFLSAFHVQDNSKQSNVAEELWHQICASIFKYRAWLRQALAQFDPEGTALVEPRDFQSVFKTFNDTLQMQGENVITDEQVDVLVQSVDLDEDGHMNYRDFIDGFVVVDTLLENAA
eukprot:GHVU01179509.1.p2 GENE.GHVU01179509.1~~GHVU01179509.1.p2  ORF type:complete len:151 (+),score=36.77 GHVU01179509.1:286-738(+)